MTVFSQLIGVGQNSEILTCVIKVDLFDDLKKAKISVKNTSPKINGLSEPIVDGIFINARFTSSHSDSKEIKMIKQEDWELEHNTHGHHEIDGYKFQYRLKPKKDHCCIKPDNTTTFTLYSDNPSFRFNNSMFYDSEHNSNPYHLGLCFRNLGEKKNGKKTICGKFMKHPKVTTTPPPPPPPPKKEPNPQTCCQILLDGKTQLVGPALYNPEKPSEYPVTHTKKIHVWIEAVCPEKVVVAGFIKKKICYKTFDKHGKIAPHQTIDEIPFQCMIDRPDANEGDQFEIVGAAILCDIFAKPANFGIHPEFNKPVAWRFVEKEIIKICIRKKDTCNPHSKC